MILSLFCQKQIKLDILSAFRYDKYDFLGVVICISDAQQKKEAINKSDLNKHYYL